MNNNRLEVAVADEEQACPYCGERQYKVVASFTRFPPGTAVRCPRCRLVRTLGWRPFEYEDNAAYASRYSGDDNVFVRLAEEFMAFVARYGPGRDLLEVGCGAGLLLEQAERRGFVARGIDLNRQSIAIARSRGLDAWIGTLEGSKLPAESVDVVCMSHVLEHIPDIHSLLAEVHRVLRPGGILALSQPNYLSPLVRLLRHLWFGWQWQQHVWHFDVPALSRLLADHQLDCIAVQYNRLEHRWLPVPMTFHPKILAVQVGAAALARLAARTGQGDQFFLAARRSDKR